MRTFWAPGRINLIGEHTDYSGGLVLPVATDLGITLVGRRADRIELTSGSEDGIASFAADGSALHSPQGWARLPAAVARVLDSAGRPPVGFIGTLSSTLPSGRGLGSSAALEVVVATALCAVAEWELPPLDLAAACQQAELEAVGVPCGILDQAAAVLGREGAAASLDCDTLEHVLVPFPSHVVLVVIDSGIRHSLEHSGYADRRRQLEEALPALQGRRPADVTLAELEEMAAAAGLSDIHRRRLRHAVTENARVRALVEALDPFDSDRVGEIFRASHASLRDDFEVSLPELDDLVELAHEHGAIGARLVGGGFGGSVLVLAERGQEHELGDAVVRGYRARHPDLNARALTCSPSAGARELT